MGTWIEQNWIALLGLAVSAATLFFVLIERAEQKRRVRAVSLDIRRSTYTANGETGEKIHENIVISNAGLESAVLIGSWLIKASPLKVDNPLPPRVLLPGIGHSFKIEPDPPEDAWWFVLYMPTSNRKLFLAEWHPLVTTSPLADEQAEQWKRTPKRWQLLRRYRMRDQPVGPGGRARVRISPRDKPRSEWIARMSEQLHQEQAESLL